MSTSEGLGHGHRHGILIYPLYLHVLLIPWTAPYCFSQTAVITLGSIEPAPPVSGRTKRLSIHSDRLLPMRLFQPYLTFTFRACAFFSWRRDNIEVAIKLEFIESTFSGIFYRRNFGGGSPQVSALKNLDNLVSFCPALDQLCGYAPIDGGESTFPPYR